MDIRPIGDKTMVEFKDIEKAILCQVAGKVIEAIPEEERKKILEASLTKCLQEILNPWHVQDAIKDDVNRYMKEYLKRPDVQERIKVATEQAVNKLMNGVIRVIVAESQDAIKSGYKEFMEKEKKK